MTIIIVACVYTLDPVLEMIIMEIIAIVPSAYME